MAEEQQDVETLKRRGRRRLVGAVALVLAAVIVLPMVFDPEPRGTGRRSACASRARTRRRSRPKPPPKKVDPRKSRSRRERRTAPPAKSSWCRSAPSPIPQAAIAKLKAAKVPYYTEPMQGNLTRVRAGPFRQPRGGREGAASS